MIPGPIDRYRLPISFHNNQVHASAKRQILAPRNLQQPGVKDRMLWITATNPG